MSKNSLRSEYTSQGWDDEHFTEFESNCGDAASESREVILVAMLDVLDESVLAQTADKAGYLA
jgi:hypothetical protein